MNRIRRHLAQAFGHVLSANLSPVPRVLSPRRVLAVCGSDDHGERFSAFLASTEVVDWHHPQVRTLAWMLSSGFDQPVEIARRTFDWVRDEIRHSGDAGDTVVTCAASEVLAQRTGLCYAKSHLLAALLRASGIPAGFCYQRLSMDGTGPPFCLHGLVALHLDRFGWYRIDPRSNKRGIRTRFAPPREYLAFAADLPGEASLPAIFADPLSEVVATLRAGTRLDAVLAALPDVHFAPSRRRAPHSLIHRPLQ
jgi:transglutaminase-like putative cysteine protease